jgi:hypothetical protein
MARFRLLQILAAGAAAGVLTAAAMAQSPAARETVLVNPEVAPKKQPEAPRAPRAISPEVASQLKGYAPKYVPPPPKPAPKPEEEEPVDARDVDKPRNGIIRLPKYIVQEPKSPVLNEQAISTDKGIKDIAVRRYISEMDRVLNGIHIPFLTRSLEDRAMEMYREDERLKNISSMKDAASTVSKSDPAQGAYILKESQKTFMRTGDFGWQGGGPGSRP